MSNGYILKGKGFACRIGRKAVAPTKTNPAPVVPVYATPEPVQAAPTHTEHDAKASVWDRVKGRVDGSEG